MTLFFTCPEATVAKSSNNSYIITAAYIVPIFMTSFIKID